MILDIHRFGIYDFQLYCYSHIEKLGIEFPAMYSLIFFGQY